MDYRSLPDQATWVAAALEIFAEVALSAADRGKTNRASKGVELLLAGGRTPEPVYQALAPLLRAAGGARCWLGDERAVPDRDPARNALLLARCFGSDSKRGGGRAGRDELVDLRPWPTGRAEVAAESYALELKRAFGGEPRFDLALLGLGEDGHTASLFPGDGAAESAWARVDDPEAPLALVGQAPSEPKTRMSLSPRALAGIKRLVFLTRGNSKTATALALLGDRERLLPARRLAELVEARGGRATILHCERD